MILKRYQIAILSFAFGIVTITFILGHVIRQKELKEVYNQPTYRSTVIKVFFSNTTEDPGILYCERTYPVEREVSRLSDNEKSELGEFLYLAIAELLEGLTSDEIEKGFFTSINPGTKVGNIMLEEGIVKVDFNERLNEGVAGSCKVQAIRSQITETLKQFPEVKEVVISVNGESETILQP